MERSHALVESAEAHGADASDTATAASDADLPTQLRQAYVAHALAGLLPARRNAFAKRALDLTLGLLLLAVALPVIGALALAIRLGWLGRETAAVPTRATGANVALPVFVRQKYVGRGGRVFMGASLPVLRATRLRRLARLPLLINVVRGEMSLVGPRPGLFDTWAAQAEPGSPRAHIPLARFYVKPGLTGPWLITLKNALVSGDTEEPLTHADLFYVAYGCLMSDLAILARTPLALFRRHT